MTQYRRASPTAIRASMDMANQYAQAGILFVPMPVFSDAEAQERYIESSERVKKAQKDAQFEA